MTLVIGEFSVSFLGAFTIAISEEAEILDVQMRGVRPWLWALLNPENQPEQRSFIIYGTGHAIQFPREELEYIGTFQQFGGRLIWHLFEVMGGRV